MKSINTSTLEQIARQTLAKVGITKLNVKVSWADEDAHYTDGSSYIVISRQSWGLDLSKRSKVNMRILTGIIQHEIIHWLQNLKEIDQSAQSVNLPHCYANLVADIQGEKMLLKILGKQACKCLLSVRRLIKKQNEKSFLDGITGDPELADAQAIMLYGRFRSPINPYCHKKRSSAKCLRGLQLSAYLHKQIQVDPTMLPGFMVSLARDFPELCKQPDAPDGYEPMPVTRSQSGITSEQIGQCQSTAYARCKVHYMNKPRGPMLQGAAELGAKLRVRLKREPSVMVIKAIGEINRRDLATDQDLPFDYTVDVDQSIGRSVILCVDLSGSMVDHDNVMMVKSADGITRIPLEKDKNGDDYIHLAKLDYMPDNMSKALLVAQATTLAVHAEQGNVIGVLFGDYALMSSGSDKSAILFPQYAHEIVTGGTSFLWIKWLWNSYATHDVIIITDGDGEVPTHITAAERERTTVIKLGDCDSERMQQIASSVIELSEIKDLPRHILNAIN